MTARDLIEMPKSILVTRMRRARGRASSRRYDLQVEAPELVAGRIDVFIKANARLGEFYSIGLRYWPYPGPAAVVLRVNGVHGGSAHEDCIELPHVHRPTDDEMDAEPLPLFDDGGPGATGPLPIEYKSIILGWEKFRELARVSSNPSVDSAIRQLYLGEDVQVELFN